MFITIFTTYFLVLLAYIFSEHWTTTSKSLSRCRRRVMHERMRRSRSARQNETPDPWVVVYCELDLSNYTYWTAQIRFSTANPVHLTQYTLRVILASFLMNTLLFSDQITAISKSCYSHIRQYLDLETASTIATSIVHSKLDYCNSLHYNLPEYQLNRLQLIQNFLARAVVRAPKSSNITPSLRSLHWLKIRQPVDDKSLSLSSHLSLTGSSSSPSLSPLSLCITPSLFGLFHFRLKTYIFHKSFPP